MKIDILSIFSEVYFSPLQESIINGAQNKEIVSINYSNLRDYTTDSHKTVDDRPYGGGPGMVFKPEPLHRAIVDLKKEGAILICPTPNGRILSQELIDELVGLEHLIFICGHYEGIDDRIRVIFSPLEVSVGDYVLTSGAMASMVIIDAVVRQIPGVLGCQDSVKNDSFYNGLLDHPHYTRPAEFMGLGVPEVLLSGNHKDIEEWRFAESVRLTKKNRPDLWEKYKEEL